MSTVSSKKIREERESERERERERERAMIYNLGVIRVFYAGSRIIRVIHSCRLKEDFWNRRISALSVQQLKA